MALSQKPPAVSVVMPTYGRRTLQAAVSSVLSQSLDDLELIIVVDPWRTPNSAWPDELTDPRVRLVKPEPIRCPSYLPARVAVLRNYGIQMAKGPYVAHLDDDNWWTTIHLEKLCSLLDSHEEYGFVHSWRIMVDPEGTPLPLDTYPWSTRYDNRQEIFDVFVDYGLVDPGRPYLRDAMLSDSGDEILHVDTSELCIRKEVHHRTPFEVNFTLRQIIEGQGNDKVLCESMYRAGIKYGCSGEYSLFYRVGGFSSASQIRVSGPS